MKLDFSFLSRKKKYNSESLGETNLSRVLGLVDLVALGVSCTLGSGVFVLAGNIIGTYTGPSIIVSFVFAGIATFLSGLSYAEFGARVIRKIQLEPHPHRPILLIFALILIIC
jgi:amino acid permease